jgi:hypothetical protein
MADITDTFKVTLIIMLFYSFSITGLVYVTPATARHYIYSYEDLANDFDFETIAGDVEENLQRQTNIPVVDVGALVFYSGNILLDLLLNFAFAIPQMFGLLLTGLTLFINIDSYIIWLLQAFISALMMALYMLGAIQLLAGIRSGRVV